MTTIDPYDHIFEVESERFLLRGVRMEDAEQLMSCYSDPRASLVFPDDNCHSGFYAHNVDQVRFMISYWLSEYKTRAYVRYAIVLKQSGACVGTIELFNRGKHGQYDNVGVLRLDVDSRYETRADISELILLVHDRLMDAFGLEALLTYAPPVSRARREALMGLGFTCPRPGELAPWPDWLFAQRSRVQTARVERYWAEFLARTGRDAHTRYIDCDHFEVTERIANELLALVLKGVKRATASSALAYALDGVDIPKPGDLSIITDFWGAPRCVIETTNVTTLAFRDMTYEICAREGEDDCLESWRNNHIAFFTADGKATGYEFSEDMPVVFEDFALVYSEPERDNGPCSQRELNDAHAVLARAMNTVKLFAERANELLSGAIISAYLCGSAPFGDFCAGYSDLDFFFVCSHPLERADFERLHALYAEYRALADGWFSALEGEIVCADAFKRNREGGNIYWGTRGDRFAPKYTLSGFSLRALFKRGMLLMGDDVRWQMPHDDESVMRAQCEQMIKTAYTHACDIGANAHYADWLFLLAQTLYYIKTRDIACKSRAAEWLTYAYDDARLSNAVEAALRIRRGLAPYTIETGELLAPAIARLCALAEESCGE